MCRSCTRIKCAKHNVIQHLIYQNTSNVCTFSNIFKSKLYRAPTSDLMWFQDPSPRCQSPISSANYLDPRLAREYRNVNLPKPTTKNMLKILKLTENGCD